jgi:hypothetical protein
MQDDHPGCWPSSSPLTISTHGPARRYLTRPSVLVACSQHGWIHLERVRRAALHMWVYSRSCFMVISQSPLQPAF